MTLKAVLSIQSGFLPYYGHCHLEHKYDIVMSIVDGTQEMKLVCNYRERFRYTYVICITNNTYLEGVAIRTRIFDFIVCPLAETRFRETIKYCVKESWKYGKNF